MLDRTVSLEDDLEQKPAETEILLTEFTLAGSLNKMAQMIHTPSPLQPEYAGELDRRHRMSVSS